MKARSRIPAVIVVGLLTVIASGTGAVAQRGGRGGGGPGSVAVGEIRSRMEILTDVLTLDNDQRKQVRAVLDAAHKGAAPIRAALVKARTALGAAIVVNSAPTTIDAAVKDYATHATAMTEAEMKALTQVLAPLSPEQRKQGTQAAFFLMRGIFLDDRRWDEIPEGKSY